MKTNKLALILLLIAQTSAADSIQPLPSIQEAVTAYVKSRLDLDGIQIGEIQLDPRLQLPLCEQQVRVFSPSGEVKPGRNTVGIRCDGMKGWTIYSQFSVKSYKNVLVLTKALRRGEVIRAEYLAAETRDVATLSQGYLLDPNEVINKQASRNLAGGSVLNSLSYDELIVVKRGSHVNIQSGRPGFAISAAGQAMADGAKGETIKVKNLASKREIQAVVVDTGVVSVYF